ncbi:MAG: phosphoribosylglycinamide formyltransferase [Crocinitomicaceae bacterium]|jgi:phosphoribosylglycinamide formyltransferase-1
MPKTKIAIFASGTGSNAINLIRFFKNSRAIEVGFVLSNNPDAPVLESAQSLGVNIIYHDNAKVANGEFLVSLCKNNGIDWIILAGYLRLIPKELISAYFNTMINLHPSLLPNYGGKGMFGSNVHRAVIANNEKESGITIHFVNQEFDKGRVIAQFTCELNPGDGVSELEQKIRHLEQSYFPTVVEKTLLG